MESVHGIAVSGGSFPAEIWRLYMEKRSGCGRRGTSRSPSASRPTSRSIEARSRSATTRATSLLRLRARRRPRPRRRRPPLPRCRRATRRRRSHARAPVRRGLAVPAGAVVLALVASRLRARVAPDSPLVPRHGGDVSGTAPLFLVLLARRSPSTLSRSSRSGGGCRHGGPSSCSPRRSSSCRSRRRCSLSTDAWTYWSYGGCGRAATGTRTRHAGGRSRQPRAPVHGERLARHDDGLRPGLHDGLRAARPSPPAAPDGRCLDVQAAGRARDRSPRRSWPGGSPGAALSPRVRRLEPYPRRAPRRRRAQRRLGRSTHPGGPGVLGVPAANASGRSGRSRSRQVGADRVLVLRVARGPRDAPCRRWRGISPLRSSSPSSRRAIRGRLAARDHSAGRERGPRDELLDPAPAGALGLPDAVASALAAAALIAGLAWLGAGAAVAPARARRLPRAGDDALPGRLVPGVGGTARRRRGGQRSRRSPCVVFCAYLLPQTIPI